MSILEELFEQVEAIHKEPDPQELARLYNTFQAEMIELIGNRPLREISIQLFHQTARVWLQILPDLNWNDEVRYVRDEIRDVIEVLQANNMQAMAQIRRDYMALLLARTSNYLGSADFHVGLQGGETG
jgi:DNA-binding GntR family transcriptional regulator